jgi:hypothetical protein
MVVVMAVDMEEVKVVIVADLLQTLAELILVLSLMRCLLRSASGIWRRDFVSSATRRDTDCFSAAS